MLEQNKKMDAKINLDEIILETGNIIEVENSNPKEKFNENLDILAKESGYTKIVNQKTDFGKITGYLKDKGSDKCDVLVKFPSYNVEYLKDLSKTQAKEYLKVCKKFYYITRNTSVWLGTILGLAPGFGYLLAHGRAAQESSAFSFIAAGIFIGGVVLGNIIGNFVDKKKDKHDYAMYDLYSPYRIAKDFDALTKAFKPQ